MSNQRRRYWIITDTHFGHEKIKEFCDRPDDFESKLLKYMKECIGVNDVLIHLGDVAWYDEAKWHAEIMNVPCFRKWLIKGNHDRKTQSWYLNQGWDFVGETLSMNIYKKRLIFSHKPLLNLTASDKTLDFNIHGHFHNLIRRVGRFEPFIARKLNNKHLLVQMEHHYRPYNLETLLATANKQDYTSNHYTFNKV